MRRMIITASLLLALSATASAQVYKWVDAQGNTHFGAQPPQGQEATQINTGIPQPKSAPAATPAPAAPPAVPTPGSTDDPTQKAVDEKVKKEVAENEEQRAKYCEGTRNNLAQLQNNPRIKSEVNGEVRRLTEEERQSKITESQKGIAENCD